MSHQAQTNLHFLLIKKVLPGRIPFLYDTDFILLTIAAAHETHLPYYKVKAYCL